MISRWKVLQHVAQRYGKHEDSFDKAAEKLELFREGKIPLASLEDNTGRMQMRIKREGMSIEKGLERINGTANFQDKNIVDKLSKKAQAVCRILKNGSPLGTGFLVAKGILITNHHVIDSPDSTGNLLAEFEYELDSNNIPKKTSLFKINAAKFFITSTLANDQDVPFSGLDFTLIGVEDVGVSGEALSKYDPIALDGNLGKIIKGESCVIIQHPYGLPKKIVLKDTAFFAETDTRLVYESDTLPGSSGSVVIGLGTSEIIALHHSGLPRTDSQDRILTKSGAIATDATPDEEIDWMGNEGIKISKIIEAVRAANVPPAMEGYKASIVQTTEIVNKEIHPESSSNKNAIIDYAPHDSIPSAPKSTTMISETPTKTELCDFLITALYKDDVLQRIKSSLVAKYGAGATIFPSMPSLVMAGEVELFVVRIPFAGDVNQEAQALIKIPEILNAEADLPLMLNADVSHDVENPTGLDTAESLFKKKRKNENGWNEPAFIEDYKTSNYVKDKKPVEYRKWNWLATKFDLALQQPPPSPHEKGIRIVQFDTGYTKHLKVLDGYDLDDDHNFLASEAKDALDATDPLSGGFLKNPGHGTRTGSLLIGNEEVGLDHNGNCGLLTKAGTKLVPYRIAETVIIINRQQQLAAALDLAISQGFDVITMSMGLPPTIATAQMAKKAYEKGIIWCCAAGNEVQFVVAPAVYPGTIAVAASNPFDRDWSASSRGDAVDITAPGQDVYVPVFRGEEGINDFNFGSGTSYATPHIAAAAAYWLAKYQDDLRTGYDGWKRVEAFRQALKQSARKENELPREGFGAGILDAEKLLNNAPIAPGKLVNAYNNWNEHAFFATLQGVGELAKTYWNILHDLFTGKKRGGQESLATGVRLSDYSKEVEQNLFATPGNLRFESMEDAGTLNDELLKRMNVINEILETSAKH